MNTLPLWNSFQVHSLSATIDTASILAALQCLAMLRQLNDAKLISFKSICPDSGLLDIALPDVKIADKAMLMNQYDTVFDQLYILALTPGEQDTSDVAWMYGLPNISLCLRAFRDVRISNTTHTLRITAYLRLLIAKHNINNKPPQKKTHIDLLRLTVI